MSHKLPCLSEQPTIRINPLLIGVILAKQHVGNVLLSETESGFAPDQCYNIVGNRHGSSLPDFGGSASRVKTPKNSN